MMDDQEKFLEHQVFHFGYHIRCTFCREIVESYQCKKSVETKNFSEYEKKMRRQEEDKCCEFCQKVFSSKSARARHEKTVHLNKAKKYNGDGNFFCNVCGKVFGRPNSLTKHERSHKR